MQRLIQRPRIRARPLLFGLSAGVCLTVWAVYTSSGGNPVDALCYWLTDPSNPYNRTDYQFVYSPAAAQIMSPLFTLQFPLFAALLRALELIALLILAGPFAAIAIFTIPVASEVNAANINLVLGVVMVLGFRWPILWTIPLLTKPSMGVGLLWFVFRREWRKLAIPLLAAGVIAGVSFLANSHLWFDWIRYLQQGTAQVGEWPYPWPIWPRLPIAIVLVAWGARTNRPWTVALAGLIALPRLYFQSPALLVAMIPLVPSLGRALVPSTRRLGRIDDIVRRTPPSDPAQPVPLGVAPAAGT